jgi:hypothetical protein
MKTALTIIVSCLSIQLIGQFTYINEPFTSDSYYNGDHLASDIQWLENKLVIAQFGQRDGQALPKVVQLDSSINQLQFKDFPNIEGPGFWTSQTLTALSSGDLAYYGSYVNNGGFGFAYKLSSDLIVLDSVFFQPASENMSANAIYKIEQSSSGKVIAVGLKIIEQGPNQEQASIELHELFSEEGTQWLGSFLSNSWFRGINSFELVNDTLAFVSGTAGSFYNSDCFLLKCNLSGDSLGYMTRGGPCSEGTSSLTVLDNGLLLWAHNICIEYVPDEQGADASSPMLTQMAISVIDPISFEIIQTHTYNHPILDDVVWWFAPYEILPTVDGGALVLMTCGYSENVIMRPMALKVNANMEQEWFEAYFPQTGSAFMSRLCNAVEWKDGYLAAGYFTMQGEGGLTTWLASIDACGKMEDLGCFPQDTVGVEAFKPSLKMWPQPASDILHLSTDSPVQEVRVWDTAGRLVLHETWAPSLSVSSLQPGLYLISVALQDGRHIGSPLMVEHR